MEEYRETNRGGKGIKTMNVTDKTGRVIAIKSVKEEDDLMIINKSGITIRIGVDEVSLIGRATQGVRLIRLDADDEIASVAKIDYIEGEDVDETTEGGEEGSVETNESDNQE